MSFPKLSPSSNLPKDFDYILENIVGGCGWWQIRTFLALCVIDTPGVWLFISVYANYEQKHRCFVQGCDSQTSALNETWTDFSLPRGAFKTITDWLGCSLASQKKLKSVTSVILTGAKTRGWLFAAERRASIDAPQSIQ